MEARKEQVPHRWHTKHWTNLPTTARSCPPSLGLSPIPQAPEPVAGGEGEAGTQGIAPQPSRM